jgi:Asp/Glu/hydantoin racemase
VRQLLVVNPNTSAAVSARLLRYVAEAVAGSDVSLRVATAGFGASYISDEPSFAIAAHAALDAVARDHEAHGPADAVLLGCFGDPGIEALRVLTGRPVVGLAESSLRDAARFGRFAVVTGGTAWKPMLERIARALGWGEQLARVEVLPASGAQLALDPERTVRELTEACRRAAVGVDAVVLGGAGLAGLAPRIAPALAVPLIDSVTAGSLALLAAAGVQATPVADPPAASAEWQGLSSPLLRRLGGDA